MSEPRRGISLAADKLRKSYRLGRVTLEVLKGVSFEVAAGEFVSIMGASGSGKSTLLHLLGLLDRPDSGSVRLDGAEDVGMSGRRRNALRCRDIGFVFQFYHLLPELNVLENVMLPARVEHSPAAWLGQGARARERAQEVLRLVGLAERLKHRPKELSGGERQRVAIARALMNDPRVLLADEPTGNLDSRTGGRIMELVHECSERLTLTVVIVTHDASVAKQAGRCLHLKDGRLVG